MQVEPWEHRAVIAGYESAAAFWESRKEPAMAQYWKRLADERREKLALATIRGDEK